MENNIDLYNFNNLDTLSDLDIDTEIIAKLIIEIKKALKANRIQYPGLNMCYQRFSNHTSLLGIKLSSGDDFDIDNYMFLGCTPDEFNHCDIYLHAKAKSAQKTSAIVNMITKSLIEFFESFESDLKKKGLENLELSFKVPLDEQPAKKETIRSLIKRLIQIK